MTHWADATFTIDGTPLEVFNVSIARAVAPLRELLRPVTYEASCEMTVDRAVFDDLAALFHPRTVGASDMTLAKRVHYGGRKGRSASRRLRAKGFPGILKIDDEPWVPCPPVTITSYDAPPQSEEL